eukprot:SAG31_NODE_1612_length_7743_cov_6.653323_5_plen_65_part_00
MSEMLFKTCMESPVDIRSELMKAIVLSGKQEAGGPDTARCKSDLLTRVMAHRWDNDVRGSAQPT